MGDTFGRSGFTQDGVEKGMEAAPDSNPNQAAPTSKRPSLVRSISRGRMTTEDVFIAFIIVACLGGAVYITVATNRVPEALIAALVAAGLSSLVYRFLGGILPSQASLQLGILKAGGSLAALVGLIYLLNPLLESQLRRDDPTRIISNSSWGWQYAAKGWQYELLFEHAKTEGRYDVTGGVYRLSPDGDRVPIQQVLAGSTAVADQSGLALNLRVKEGDGKLVTWKSVGPLKPENMLRGELRVIPDDALRPEYSSRIYLAQQH